jgi:hypothetical protein
MEVRVEVEILVDFEIVVDAEEVGHVADVRASLGGMAQDVDARDLGLAAIRRDQRCQRPNRGGLARAVLTDEAVDGARRHLHVESIERIEAPAVALDQAARADHEGTSPTMVSSGAWKRTDRSRPPLVTWIRTTPLGLMNCAAGETVVSVAPGVSGSHAFVCQLKARKVPAVLGTGESARVATATPGPGDVPGVTICAPDCVVLTVTASMRAPVGSSARKT